MRKTTFIIVCSTLFFSCNNQNQPSSTDKMPAEKTNDKTEILVPERKIGKPYFEFDAIEHYFLDISKGEANDLYMNEKPNLKEKELKDILHGDNVENINKLTKFGFKKSNWEEPKLKIAREIFTENNCEWYAAACITVFRDIYVFKKKEKIIGTAKVCFDCRQYIIDGTKSNTDNFGQGGDFEKLYEISR